MDSPRSARRLTLSSKSWIPNDSSTRATSVDSPPHSKTRSEERPLLFQRITDERSILALAVSKTTLYAGTQGGELVTWSLASFEELSRKRAHSQAILCLRLTHEDEWLLSCAGDGIVNVWHAETGSRLYSIYSTYDVGDVFCVVYSPLTNTIFLGAQNTSIQWYDLLQKDVQHRQNLERHPSHRSHRFFDSKGPGGVSTPRPDDTFDSTTQGGAILEIDKINIIQYAHFGYVYCMEIYTTSSQDKDEILISGGGDGTVKLWKLNSGSKSRVEEWQTLPNGDNSILSMALNNSMLYVGQSEGKINVWDLETTQLIQSFTAYHSDVMTLSTAHGVVFTGGADGCAKIFERYKCKSQWRAHNHLILASAVHERNGKLYILTGGNDNQIASWDLTDLFTSSIIPTKPSPEQLVQSLNEFVSYRTVSSRPEYAEDCRRGASWLRGLFKKYGATTQSLRVEGNGNPVVYARFRGKGSATARKQVLFYGHYDVVDVADEPSKWCSDPFDMDGRDGYLYGRGVTDNKGPILAAIYAVVDLVAEKDLNCDVTFLIEGEEEIGSPGFESCVRQNKELIGEVDWILLANSSWLNDEIPCLTYGLRGVIHLEICVEGGQRDLHSGVNGSQLMNEPLKDLVNIVATLTLSDGRINIPGFNDDILDITAAEDRRYETLSAILRDSDIEHGTEMLKSRWRQPSLTIHGFKTSSPGLTTVIPHLASASISLRLVPDQSSAHIQASLQECLYARWDELATSNKLIVKTGRPVDPWLGDPDNKIFRVLEQAVTEVWEMGRQQPETKQEQLEVTDSKPPKKSTPKVSARGKAAAAAKKERVRRTSNGSDLGQQQSLKPCQPLYIREGGSIPAIRFLEREFNAAAAQLPCGQASDNAHLDNERIRLLNLYNSRTIMKRVFRDLALE